MIDRGGEPRRGRSRPTSGWWTSSRRSRRARPRPSRQERAVTPERRGPGSGDRARARSSDPLAQRAAAHLARGVHGPSEAGQAARAAARRAWPRRRNRLGAMPRRWRSRRCSPRACRSGSPARTPSAARSASGTWCCTTRRPDELGPDPEAARRAGAAGAAQQPALGAGDAGLRVRVQRRGARGAGAVGGAVRRLHQRRAGDRGPVPRRRGSPSGGSPPDSRSCCRTDTRARDRSTRARGWSASSSSPPRATSGSPTPPRRRSTSTCSAARRGGPASVRWWS